MCEHKNSEKLFGLTNEKGEKVVITICKDCMSILNYTISKEEKVKEKESDNSYSIEKVYETFRKLKTVSAKVSINDVMSGLGLKKSQKNEFIEFINVYKDYFYHVVAEYTHLFRWVGECYFFYLLLQFYIL